MRDASPFIYFTGPRRSYRHDKAWPRLRKDAFLLVSRFPPRLRLFPIGESKLTRTRGIRFPCPSLAQPLPLSFFSTAIFTTAETNGPARSMDPVRKAWNCIPHGSHLPFVPLAFCFQRFAVPLVSISSDH